MSDPFVQKVEQALPLPPSREPWQPPRFQVISLDCEITAYAPDDRPLF